ncbi:MAG: hypothetical protein COB04_18060 [Gammaproteobacteria bacterium]|nr:MAG: hypothetical protein COB04_18920 [Gammaproteobacteria bacterium]PCJ12197.1 MAG: hypothetical protein COB04_18060 [Gammaproteobacteria bacterium]
MNQISASKVTHDGSGHLSVIKVSVREHEVFFEEPNASAGSISGAIFEDQADTMNWIDQFGVGDTFVDIGARGGMHSIYAAVARQAKVIAFEPEAQNYALLNRNIIYNNLQQAVTAYCLVVADGVKAETLFRSENEAGEYTHALSDTLENSASNDVPRVCQGVITWSLDRLVDEKVIPVPNHIKVDLNGLEQLTLRGAQKSLSNPALKSILVEMNVTTKEHAVLVDRMKLLGFDSCQGQLSRAVGQGQSYGGRGHLIFFRPETGFTFPELKVASRVAIEAAAELAKVPLMDSALVIQHMVSRCKQVRPEDDPYPYFCMDNLFPDQFYQQLLEHKPTNSQLEPMSSTPRAYGGSFDNRFMMNLNNEEYVKLSQAQMDFWRVLDEALMSNEFAGALTHVFMKQLLARGVLGKGGKGINLYSDALFMRDNNGFRMGPHSDRPERFITMMIYLPENSERSDLGTCIYRPTDASLTSEGLHHYKYGSSEFSLHHKAPYVPNACMVFLKTNNSFHGLETLPMDYQRDTICYTLKHASPQ